MLAFFFVLKMSNVSDDISICQRQIRKLVENRSKAQKNQLTLSLLKACQLVFYLVEPLHGA